jgi:glucose-1-phosphate adenylyltransferase
MPEDCNRFVYIAVTSPLPQPVTTEDASSMGTFRFDRNGQIVAFEEKPNRDRLDDIGHSIPKGATFGGHSGDKPFVASMGIYVFSRDVLLDVIEQENAADFGRLVIPAALGRYKVNAHLFRGYWADVGTVASFYDANIMLTRAGTPFKFDDPRSPIDTHTRFLPGARLSDCVARDAPDRRREPTRQRRRRSDGRWRRLLHP